MVTICFDRTLLPRHKTFGGSEDGFEEHLRFPYTLRRRPEPARAAAARLSL
jgi:hypothetical protein